MSVGRGGYDDLTNEISTIQDSGNKEVLFDES